MPPGATTVYLWLFCDKAILKSNNVHTPKFFSKVKKIYDSIDENTVVIWNSFHPISNYK